MEQPLESPKSFSPKQATTNNNKKRRPPSPEEVLAHYESGGLDSKEASLKAISDLKALLFRSVASGRGKKDRLLTDAARKLDNLSTRLTILEMKLDSKPGIPESIAIGVASSAIVQALAAAKNIWDSVKSATKSSH